jgi:hypothetical protein
MGLLEQVTKGKNIGPQIHVIAGNNGVGKTTWAASFPSPIIADIENGSNHLDVSRVGSDKLKNLESFRALVVELKTAKHDYKTFVVDSVESLEALISDQVCIEGKVTSIEMYEGGFGKGYTRTREIMRELFADFEELKAKGITIILVAHTQVKQHNDPVNNQSYDRVIMRCNDKMAAIIRDLSDNVFYATYKVLTTKEKGKTKAFGDGQRVMYTQWRPGFDAKNRLELPLEIPLSFESFIELCDSDSKKEDLITDINEMSTNVDEKLRETVKQQVEKFKDNPTKLKEIKNRLMKYQTTA